MPAEPKPKYHENNRVGNCQSRRANDRAKRTAHTNQKKETQTSDMHILVKREIKSKSKYTGYKMMREN